MKLVFWQRIVSPHMAPLAQALARRGVDVTYITQQLMSEERLSVGWRSYPLTPARLVLAEDSGSMINALDTLPDDSIHICQGLRANGPIATIQMELRRRQLQQWAILETVDDHGVAGLIKRFVYRRLCREHTNAGGRILAIGDSTKAWLVDRGVDMNSIAPFCYFLPEQPTPSANDSAEARRARVAFAGRLVPLKRVEDLILALSQLPSAYLATDLWIVGAGPEDKRLRSLADKLLPGRVRWFGLMDQARVSDVLSQVDCLVLPSRHDGWGAVISEALLVGTPAICTDQCGAAAAVRASGCGGVYPVGDVASLSTLLAGLIGRGPRPSPEREQLREWAKCLTADSGAKYLERLMSGDSHIDFLRPIHTAPRMASAVD